MKDFKQKLLLASHNKGKVEELRALLAPLGIQVISAKEAGIDEPEETGTTFAENAQLKAEHAAAQSGLPALADDSGLVIPALGGAPGIYSARWAGPDKDFTAAFARIRSELDARGATSLPEAHFSCALCLYIPGESAHLFEGKADGTLTFPPRGDRGFGYDPVFIPAGYDITFGEMAEAEKNRISHRAEAFSQLKAFLQRRTS